MANEKLFTLIVVQPVGFNRMFGTKTVMTVIPPDVAKAQYSVQNGNTLEVDTRNGATECRTYFLGGDANKMKLTGQKQDSVFDGGYLGRVNMTVLRGTKAEIGERIQKTPNRKVLED